MVRRVAAAVFVFVSMMLVATGCGSRSCGYTPDGQVRQCQSETNWPAIIGVLAGLLVLAGLVVLLVVLLVRSSRASKARREQELQQMLQGPPALGDQQPPMPGPPMPGTPQQPAPPPPPEQSAQWWQHTSQVWDSDQPLPTAPPPAPPTMTPPLPPAPESAPPAESGQDQRAHWDVPPQWQPPPGNG